MVPDVKYTDSQLSIILEQGRRTVAGTPMEEAWSGQVLSKAKPFIHKLGRHKNYKDQQICHDS